MQNNQLGYIVSSNLSFTPWKLNNDFHYKPTIHLRLAKNIIIINPVIEIARIPATISNKVTSCTLKVPFLNKGSCHVVRS